MQLIEKKSQASLARILTPYQVLPRRQETIFRGALSANIPDSGSLAPELIFQVLESAHAIAAIGVEGHLHG